MAEKIQIGDKWYVAATSARLEENPQVLKFGETFVMFDRFGDLQALGPCEQGLYHEDTRYLSHQELQIDGARPLFLSSTVKDNNSLLIIELMNPDLTANDVVRVPKGTMHIFRAKLLWQDSCYEHIRVTNHGGERVGARLALTFDADFIDLFEVRGMQRQRHGTRLPAEVGEHDVVLRYQGRDDCLRSTRVHFKPAPAELDERHAVFDLALDPGAEAHIFCTVTCIANGSVAVGTAPPVGYQTAFAGNNAARSAALERRCQVETSNPLVNLWLNRSASDLTMLTTALPSGPYPYAGVPWYSTTFGRDGILTAREYLWIDPSLARGVLAFLADTQAREEDPERDAEPGKILHEARKCEMARTREIPFGRYYGTVDATPLFVALAGAYFRRTGDLAFIREIWPNVTAALHWIDRYGDADGDGFVEYACHSADGLVQQGWKDSADSIFHRDGEFAEAPIALCEVQGYVYEGKLFAAELAHALGDDTLAARLHDEAETLKQRFDEAFWCEDLGTYAIALDGSKAKCKVASSNAGHALWTGIASNEHAPRVVDNLMSEDAFCGWGIRTILRHQARYNPMSYHNGSVWPHDNALIAAGMARYGRTQEAMRILSALFDASQYFEGHRLPELFCGFPRRDGEGPTLYPVACSPQAWASAAAFSMLQACLGLEVHAEGPKVTLCAPRLPEFIQWMKVDNLNVGGLSVDLLLQRYRNNVGIEVMRKAGDIEVVVAI